jgi:hypothetical protein
VTSDSDLRNVILIAPQIRLEKGVRACMQGFITDSLIVDKDVSLYYPTVLCLVKEKSVKNAVIHLSENDSLWGSIIALRKGKDLLTNTLIETDKNSYMEGEIYTDGMTEVKGIVYGSVVTNSIYLSTPTSVYENHLLNATIDIFKRSDYFLGVMRNEDGKMGIIKNIE